MSRHHSGLEKYFWKQYIRCLLRFARYIPASIVHFSSSNAFQQRYYGKLYCMCVVQKCRFQNKYTRYQQGIIRMKGLYQEHACYKSSMNMCQFSGACPLYFEKSS